MVFLFAGGIWLDRPLSTHYKCRRCKEIGGRRSRSQLLELVGQIGASRLRPSPVDTLDVEDALGLANLEALGARARHAIACLRKPIVTSQTID